MQQRNEKNIVLVVEDSPETLSMLNHTLEESGLAVLVALEGKQALAIANNIVPDIVLMDAIMPNLDGFETCKQLKQLPAFAHVPIIFMTGLSDTESVVKGFDAGGIDYITKPINTDQLVARMQAHLANSRQTLSARQALDSTGQHIFSCDSDGRLLWATPLTYDLINNSGLDDAWLKTILPVETKKILAENFNKERGVEISQGNKPLEIRYVSQTGANEYLMRLVNLERPSETELLREKFGLTEREADVLLWIAHGKTNREIGVILDMSPRTVNKHLEQIFPKLNVENRTTAAVMAAKIISP